MNIFSFWGENGAVMGFAEGIGGGRSDVGLADGVAVLGRECLCEGDCFGGVWEMF